VVSITYESARAAASGSTVLTAALDRTGTEQAEDSYTYVVGSSAAVAQLVWSPTPIAAPGSLSPGQKVPLTLTTLTADGSPTVGKAITLCELGPGQLTCGARGEPATRTVTTGRDGTITIPSTGGTATAGAEVSIASATGTTATDDAYDY
jgi:hypothetical protein